MISPADRAAWRAYEAAACAWWGGGRPRACARRTAAPMAPPTSRCLFCQERNTDRNHTCSVMCRAMCLGRVGKARKPSWTLLSCACSCAAQVLVTRCGALRRAARPALPARPERRARRQDEGARDAAAALLAMKAAPPEPALADLLACSPSRRPSALAREQVDQVRLGQDSLQGQEGCGSAAVVLVLRGPGAQGRAGREARAACRRAGLVGPVAPAWQPGCAQRACTKASSAG